MNGEQFGESNTRPQWITIMDEDNENESSWFEQTGKFMVGLQLRTEDWPEEYEDRISFEEDFDYYIFGDEDPDECEWLNWLGSGSGMGVVDVTYETTDPNRFLLQARIALKKMKVPASARIVTSDEKGKSTYHPVYEK